MAALAFVPPNDVPDVYEQLKAAFPEDDASDEILMFYEVNYIKGVPLRNNRPRDPPFPITLWNQHEAA